MLDSFKGNFCDTITNMDPKIIVMGPVGSGKSTQAALLAKHFKVPHVETGTLFRQLSKTRQDIKEIIEAGKLAPDSLTLNILREELSGTRYKRGFIVDGVPRNLTQAKRLPFNPDVVLYLRVRDDVNLKRLLLRGRADDTEELIKKRLAIYHRQTTPVLDFYKKQTKLLEIDGEPAIEVIFKDILNRLSSKLKTER